WWQRRQGGRRSRRRWGHRFRCRRAQLVDMPTQQQAQPFQGGREELAVPGFPFGAAGAHHVTVTVWVSSKTGRSPFRLTIRLSTPPIRSRPRCFPTAAFATVNRGWFFGRTGGGGAGAAACPPNSNSTGCPGKTAGVQVSWMVTAPSASRATVI